MEIRAGLRHPEYRQALEEMQLLTPHLEALWQQRSLSDAILAVLVGRGILSSNARPSQQAEQLAAIWLPTGTGHPHADLAALAEQRIQVSPRGTDGARVAFHLFNDLSDVVQMLSALADNRLLVSTA